MKHRFIRILSLFLLLTVLVSTLILPMAAAASVMTIKYTFWGGTNYITYTVYYDDAGNEVLFNPGTTYIQFLKTEKSFEILG